MEEDEPARGLSATVGVFDGLHIGHRRLIECVFAHGDGRDTGVFTFTENPKKLLKPSSYHGALSSLEQKLEMLEALGLDLCVLIDFSGNFSKLAGRDFLSSLKDKGNLQYIAVGSNFSCGYKLDTHAHDIKDFYGPAGIGIDVLDPVLWEGHAVSSSRIRNAIRDGRIDDATAMLGRPYEIDLRRCGPGRLADGRWTCGRPEGIVLPPEGRYDAMAIGKGNTAPALMGVNLDRLEIQASTGWFPERVAVNRLTKETKR
jgi:riboflavin kinase/FMN adenylyltransferase